MNHVRKNIDDLINKLSLENGSAEELTAVAQEYPYFGVSQFLLARQLKLEARPEALRQLQQTALYFPNPFWLHYLLSAENLVEVEGYQPISGIDHHYVPVSAQTTMTGLLTDNPPATPLEEGIMDKVPAVAPKETTDIYAKPESALVDSPETQESEPETAPVEAAADIPPSIIDEDLSLNTTTTVEERQTDEAALAKQSPTDVLPPTETDNPEPDQVLPSPPAVGRTDDQEPASQPTDTEPVQHPAESSSRQQQDLSEGMEHSSKIASAADTTDATAEASPDIDALENNDAEREKLSKLIEQHLSEFKKPVDSNAEIPFTGTVYHAIDYFASQGIKLDPSTLNEDQLQNKVRKFTDWLKQMKRINENPTDLGTDIETEHLIEKIAQTSNEAKDVITETMAEVLVKQGKVEKAIQLYQKLSFLNPSKSTYFAAKINDLKV